jgi:hypothetical protein
VLDRDKLAEGLPNGGFKTRPILGENLAHARVEIGEHLLPAQAAQSAYSFRDEGVIQDPIESSAYLVDGAGDIVGHLAQPPLGLLRLAFQRLLLGYIDNRADEPTDRSVREVESIDPEHRIVRAVPERQLRGMERRLSGAQDFLVAPVERLAHLRGNMRQLVHRLADQVFPAGTKGFFIGAVAPDKARVLVLDVDWVGNRIEQRALVAQLVGQRPLGFFLLADIDRNADQPSRRAVIQFERDAP